jgi:hypothetical protein
LSVGALIEFYFKLIICITIPEEPKTITYSLSIENAERFNEVAYELESLWMDHAYRLGFEVNMSGRPKYELEDV